MVTLNEDYKFIGRSETSIFFKQMSTTGVQFFVLTLYLFS